MASNFFYTIGVHGMFTAMRLASLWMPKVRSGINGRAGLRERLFKFGETHASPFWFHVASAGELEQAIPVMDEIKRRDDGHAILLTFFSPSGERAALAERERRTKLGLTVPWDHGDYLPVDLPNRLRPLFKKLSPRLLVLVHRELWPNLIAVARENQVPTALISTFWPDAPPNRRITKCLSGLAWIGTVDESSANKISQQLGRAAAVTVAGDPRAERVMVRKGWNTKRDDPFSATTHNPIFLLASLHKEDIRKIYSLPSIMKYAPTRWVVVPHEPRADVIAELKDWLTPLGAVGLWSEGERVIRSNVPLIVDKVGFLAELYEAAHLVLVGGSYYYRVHNVWEPAAYYKPILTGTFIQNSAEARSMADAGWLKICPTAVAIADEANRLLKIPAHYQGISAGLETFLSRHSNVSQNYATKLIDLALK